MGFVRPFVFLLGSLKSSIVRAESALALAMAPWLCMYGDSDANTGVIWLKQGVCKFEANFYFSPPSASDPTINIHEQTALGTKISSTSGLCLNAGITGLTFENCVEGAPRQQWIFQRQGGFAKKFAAASGPDGGRILLMDPSVTEDFCLMAHWGIYGFDAGARLSLLPCDGQVYESWTYREPSPANKELLVMPTGVGNLTPACVGIDTAGPGGTMYPVECDESVVANWWVRSIDGRIRSAVSDLWCMIVEGYGLQAGLCGSQPDEYELWDFNESSGALTLHMQPQFKCCGSWDCATYSGTQIFMDTCDGKPNQVFAFASATAAATRVMHMV